MLSWFLVTHIIISQCHSSSTMYSYSIMAHNQNVTMSFISRTSLLSSIVLVNLVS